MLSPRPVFIIALITGVCLLGDSALYVLLPAHLEVFAMSPTSAGLVLGINRYIRIISNSGAAWVIHRVGCVWPLVAAVVLAGITTLAYGLFTGFLLLFIAHGFWGLSWSILRLSGYIAAVETGASTAIGRHMGVFQSVSRGGSLIAVIGGGFLADRIGPQETFIVFGVISFAAVGLIPFARIPSNLGRRKTEYPAPQAYLEAAVAQWRIRILYGNALVAWLVVSGLTATVGYVIATRASNGVSVLGVVLGVSTFSGMLLGVRWVTDLGLGPALGHLSDRIGRHKIMVGVMSVFVFAYAILALTPPVAAIAFMFSIVFIGSSALMISLNAMVAESARPEQRTMIIGRYTTWADIGSGTGPIIALPLLTNVGFGWTYGGASIVILLAAVVYSAVFTRRHG